MRRLGGMANKTLQNAKKAKNDEFYTQLNDIEQELKHYRSILRIKVFYATATIRMKATFLSFSQ